MVATPHDILGFWRQAGPAKWFARNAAFDEAIRLKFEPTHHAAARGEYDAWAGTPEGALALVILLDQFPRNLYRGSGHAFATDGKARAVAKAAVARGWHREVEPGLAQFFVLPFEHSEDLADQDQGLAVARELGDAEVIKWVEIHRDIIVRFGRFPHRNPMLGRITTPAEQAFLDDGGFAG
ncbi:DUF924 family protein [Phenylobacterium sp.]|uniref:DUF924 family protein n=1 Tax=Phenylobacterium sp. TaxID=1871053 RepID=UPI002811A9C1|nr:DUF924 family protein [Phenylobacterium sp.]